MYSEKYQLLNSRFYIYVYMILINYRLVILINYS